MPWVLCDSSFGGIPTNRQAASSFTRHAHLGGHARLKASHSCCTTEEVGKQNHLQPGLPQAARAHYRPGYQTNVSGVARGHRSSRAGVAGEPEAKVGPRIKIAAGKQRFNKHSTTGVQIENHGDIGRQKGVVEGIGADSRIGNARYTLNRVNITGAKRCNERVGSTRKSR